MLGLLAMHGLASTHHAVATTPASATAAPHAHGGDAQEQHSSAEKVLAIPSTGAGLSEPLCADDCPDALTALCVAVLTSAAAAAVLVAGRDWDAVATPWRQQQECRPAATDRPPDTPDSVAELCISRT